MTATEFWQLPGTGKHRELVHGEVVETMPPGVIHGAIAVALGMLLRLWCKAGAGGYVGAETGYILARDPDTVRGPDISYVRAERYPATGLLEEGFWALAPDLAVEIVSPHETADEVREKVRDYLAAGTPLVWTIYPRTRDVIVHTPDGLARTYGPDAILSFPDILPGFTCTVAELFDVS
jgi:Uma2 family endonuclease